MDPSERIYGTSISSFPRHYSHIFPSGSCALSVWEFPLADLCKVSWHIQLQDVHGWQDTRCVLRVNFKSWVMSHTACFRNFWSSHSIHCITRSPSQSHQAAKHSTDFLPTTSNEQARCFSGESPRLHERRPWDDWRRRGRTEKVCAHGVRIQTMLDLRYSNKEPL